MTINVLGTEYSVVYREFKDEGCDGMTDYTSHTIELRNDNYNGLGGFTDLMKKQTRHEIIHAFMAESGLQANWEHTQQWGHDETTVDWFAIQFPKMLKVFTEVGCL